MRVVVFTTLAPERLAPWHEVIRQTQGVSAVMIVRLSPGGAAPEGLQDFGSLLVDVRAWHADCGLAIGVPSLPPVFHTLPARGTLGVRMGHGPVTPDEPPGFWEMWSGADRIVAEVDWLGLERAGVGAVGAAPVYPHDTPASLGARAEELGRLLVSAALRAIAEGKPLSGRRTRPAEAAAQPTPPQRLAMWSRVLANLAKRWLGPLTLGKLAGTMAWLALVRPARDAVRTLRRRHPVRIYTLHRVTRLCRDGMTVSPSVFRRQLEYLRRHHDVVTLDAAIALIARGARLRRPVAAITFDDGYASVAQSAVPIMESLGVVGAVFVCPRIVDERGRFAHDEHNPARPWMTVMDWGAIRRLRDAGWHVGSHGSTHVRLSTLTGEPLLQELRDARIALRERIGVEHMAFAYPFGGERDITPEGIETARWCGYSALLSDFGGENLPDRSDRFALRRIDIGGDHDTLMWKAMIHAMDLKRLRQLAGRRNGRPA